MSQQSTLIQPITALRMFRDGTSRYKVIKSGDKFFSEKVKALIFHDLQQKTDEHLEGVLTT